MVPTTCSVSEPPAPPSTLSIEAPLASTNVSALSAAPSSCSTSEKLTLPSDPEFAPVTFHVLSTAGPASVSCRRRRRRQPRSPRRGRRRRSSAGRGVPAANRNPSDRSGGPALALPVQRQCDIAVRRAKRDGVVGVIDEGDHPLGQLDRRGGLRGGGRRRLDRSRCLGLCCRLLSGRCGLLGRGRSLLGRRRRFLGRGRGLLRRGQRLLVAGAASGVADTTSSRGAGLPPRKVLSRGRSLLVAGATSAAGAASSAAAPDSRSVTAFGPSASEDGAAAGAAAG